jgi:hypothetical protein
VEVYLEIFEDNDYHTFYYLYNQSETVDYGHDYYTGILERNATHLGFMLTLHHNDGSGQTILTPLYIPLDPGDCMCSTMEDAADNIHNLTSFSCSVTDEECTSIQCDIADIPGQSVGVTVSPCDDPPSLQFAVIVNGNTQSISADGNKTVSLGEVDADLRIRIWHFDYSMDVELTVISDFITQIILPRHKIILNLTECGPPHPIDISSTATPVTEFTEPTVPSTTDSSYDMCAALHSISVLDGTICSTNDACTALECEVVNNRVQLGLEVCHHPPGIRVSVYDSREHAVFNEAFYNGTRTVSSKNLPFSLVVTVEHPSPMTITVEVSWQLVAGVNIPLVPRTVIPIDNSSCSSLPPPTTGPTTTCSAMRYIGDAISRTDAIASCYFPEDHNCSVLTCPIQAGVDLTIRILRCAHPPAMRVTLGSGFQTLFDHTFDHSEIVPLGDGTTINVTVDQLRPSDIGFQVDSTSPDRKHTTEVVPYTVIPIDTTGCDPNAGSGGGGPGGKDSNKGLSKAVLATAVTVPLVVLLLIAAVIVIVAGVYWARQRRNRHYQFRRMAMSQVDDDEEC